MFWRPKNKAASQSKALSIHICQGLIIIIFHLLKIIFAEYFLTAQKQGS